MKLAIKGIVVALGAMAGSQAHATVALGNNAELFLSVFDPTSEKSYMRDLGVTLPNFLPNSATRPTDGAAFAFGAAPTYQSGSVLAAGYGFSFALDPVLTTFLAQSAAHLEDLVWNIGALDNSSLGNPTKILTTTNATAASIAAMTNSNYNQAINSAGPPSYVTTSNTLGTHPGGIAVNGSNTAVAANGLAYFPTIYGSNLGSFASFSTTAGLGGSLSSYIISSSGAVLTDPVAAAAFRDAAGEGIWSLSDAGVLSYSVAAIPEPGTYALLGAGLLMLGAIARRRLN